MGFAEQLAELKNHKNAPSSHRQNRQNSPSVSFVSPVGSPSAELPQAQDTDDFPSEPCRACGSSNFYEADGWYCTRCYPPKTPPQRSVTVPGGSIPPGEPQDLETALRRAVIGTDLSVEALRSALDENDLNDVRLGRMCVRTLRAFLKTLKPDRPRTVKSVQCGSCQHYRRRDHPNLGECAVGIPADGAAGLWDTDYRYCSEFSEQQSNGTAKERSHPQPANFPNDFG